MKKLIVIAVIAIIAVLAMAPTFAMIDENPESEMLEVQEIFLISGEIMETGEGYVLIDGGEAGMVQVNIAEETIMETSGDLAAGDYIHVDYDGKMTRSIPAQITALLIRCYTMEGTVSEVLADENAFLMETETHGQVQVNLPENSGTVPGTGDAVKVYFNGAMTMSLPGQICADRVVAADA